MHNNNSIDGDTRQFREASLQNIFKELSNPNLNLSFPDQHTSFLRTILFVHRQHHHISQPSTCQAPTRPSSSYHSFSPPYHYMPTPCLPPLSRPTLGASTKAHFSLSPTLSLAVVVVLPSKSMYQNGTSSGPLSTLPRASNTQSRLPRNKQRDSPKPRKQSNERLGEGKSSHIALETLLTSA